MASFSQMQSQFQSQMQSQGLALPSEPLVGPSGPRVSTKESCVDPLGNDPEAGNSDRCGLYIEANPACLVALGRVFEGSTIVHNTPLLPGQVKVGVEEVKDPDAPVPVPTDEVSLVGQTIHTFLAWPNYLVKSLSQQAVVSPAKPPQKPDLEVNDLLYLMTLTIPELFLRPYQVTWDVTMFGVFNPDFSLYIKHEDLFEIAHGGQCLSISVLQLWILHLTETSMRAWNSDIYGFLEPQSIQRSGQSQFETESYIKSWMQSLKRDAYLGAYLNGGHWQMVVIMAREHLVVWFCSLHNMPDNYIKGIINSALKGLDDVPQPKSKALARWIVVKGMQPKVTAISESKDLSSMSLATLFGKLKEHEMELQRLNQNEETGKRKRSIALKASSSMQEEEEEESNDEEDFLLFVKKFHKFIKYRRMERCHNFNNGKRSQEVSPTLKCYKCNQPGHIKANYPSNESWPEKNEKKKL
ncbi:hypothetical protein HKD37_12G033893 [Glycine soja]